MSKKIKNYEEVWTFDYSLSQEMKYLVRSLVGVHSGNIGQFDEKWNYEVPVIRMKALDSELVRSLLLED